MSSDFLARAVLACALLPAPAFAETKPADIVVTAIRDAAAAPGGSDIVSADTFADKVAVSLRDALAFSPGVYLQPRFGQEVRLSIRGSGLSRGFHMRGILLFQDGVPINLADNNGDFQEFDPQVFERIEVLRGGNALRLGGSTLGGSIDATTPTGRSQPGFALRMDGGSFGTLRFKAAAGMATARGDAWLALTGDRSDGDRDHARRDALRFNGNVGLRLTERLETRFYASLNHIDQDLPGTLTRAQALSTPKLSLPVNVLMDQERDIDSIRVQNRTSYDLGDTGTLTTGAFLNVKQLFHPIFQVIDQKSVDTGLFARADLKGAVAGLPVEASLGVTARRGKLDGRQYLNVAGRRGVQTAAITQRAHTIDAYGEVRIQPAASLTLVAGALLTDGKRTLDNLRAPARSGSASFTPLAPKFGLIFTPAAGIELFANYSRSVELPGFGELTQTPFAVVGVVTPGFVDISPQRAWTAEAGARGTLGPVRFDIALYRADLHGEFLQYDQGVGIPAAVFNADRTRHEGIEAGLDLTITPWATLRQVYQYSDFRFRGDAVFGDNRLPVIPRHLYRAEVTLGPATAHVTPRVEWVPRGAWADYANTTRAPGYVLLSLGGEVVVAPDTTVFLDARNLTNRHAIGDISAVTVATAASAIYYPVERRALYGGVRTRF